MKKEITKTVTGMEFEHAKSILYRWLFKSEGKWFYRRPNKMGRKVMEVTEDFAIRYILDTIVSVPFFGNQSLWQMKYRFNPATREWNVFFPLPATTP